MNFGYSSRLSYDNNTYGDKLSESVAPLLYRLNTNRIANNSACISTFGPRSGHNGCSVSTVIDYDPSVNFSVAQDLVDFESTITNRKVVASSGKNGNVNDFDFSKIKLKNRPDCNKIIDPISSRLTLPSKNYKSIAVNRFYDLNKNPQEPIFWDFATNTRLEAKDNYKGNFPKLKYYDALLLEELGVEKLTCDEQCNAMCPFGCAQPCAHK